MSIVFEDRVSAYPNRYLMTGENGNASYVILERADEPVKVGTPLNAETFNNMLNEAEDAQHPGCYYHKGNGEWLNPPMVDGEEYRTTERWMGKPVLTKIVAFKPTSESDDTVDLHFDDIAVLLIRSSACVLDGDGTCFTLPNSHIAYTVDFCSLWESAAHITASINGLDSDFGSYTFYFQVWYVQE